MTPQRRRIAFVFASIAIAAAGMYLAYAGQLFTGLYYDDYHFVRPLSADELTGVWSGTWDPTHIESVFYRPLAAWFFAARFWLFGINADAMHFMTAAGHVACATLVALLLRRERAAASVALFAAGLYAIYPTFPYAQTSWLTNQMHLVESLVVLGALHFWQTARDRSLVWWIPVFLCAVIVFLIKEDGIMLLPAIAGLTIVRRWILGQPLPQRWPLLLASAIALAIGLVYFRFAQLGRLGGYGKPSLSEAYTNFWKGLPAAISLWPTRRPWQGIASLMAILSMSVAAMFGWRRVAVNVWAALVTAALVAWLCFDLKSLFLERVTDYPLITLQGLSSGVIVSLLVVGGTVALVRRDRLALSVLGAGLVIAIAFNVPFVFKSKREQFHLLSLGAVIAAAGAWQAIAATISRPVLRAMAWLLIAGAMTPLTLLARGEASNFVPCAEGTLRWDQEIPGWAVVPDEIKAWTVVKAQQCASTKTAPDLTDLPLATWGVYGEEHEGADAYRWTTDHTVLLTAKQTTGITLAFRRPREAPQVAIDVTIRSASGEQHVVLDSADWKYATVPLTSNLLSWLRDGHRIDVYAAPSFLPRALNPASTDDRRLGVQLRVVPPGQR